MVARLATIPKEGSTIRFGPTRNRKLASKIWRLWVQRSNIYAMVRSLGADTPHISVHESGQIHFRQGRKKKQDLFPLMQLGLGPWLHAFELQFLLNDNLPPGELESLKKETALAIEVPDEAIVLVNLIIGPAGSPLDLPLPVEFSGGQTIWRTRLCDDRIAVLVSRCRRLDDADRQYISKLHDRKMTLTVDTKPEKPYAEYYDIFWSPGGNVICILPMGDDAFRSDQETQQPDAIPALARTFHYRSVGAEIEITAPDGKMVGVIDVPEVEKQIELVKGQPKLVQLGLVTMQAQPSNLIPGSRFLVRPPAFASNPQVDGACFPDWRNEIVVEFDGFRITAVVCMTSGGLLNKNLAKRIEALGNEEEIVVAIPSDTTMLSATRDLPSASTEYFARFTLRDRR